MKREERIFFASLKVLHPLLLWVHEVVKNIPFSMKERNDLDLCVEEIFVNIVKHGLKDENLEVFIIVQAEECAAEITFKDLGKAFNPMEMPVKKLEIEKGRGVGIFLVIELCDKISYSRKDDVNILTIRKESKNRT